MSGIDNYSTSLIAGLRALEGWRKQNRWRAYEIASPYGSLEGFAVSMFVELGNHEPIFPATPQPSPKPSRSLCGPRAEGKVDEGTREAWQGMPGEEKVIEITVIGTPGPQGSKRHVGHGRMIESSKKVAPWREAVAWAARAAMGDRPPLVGPLRCEITYTLSKPKSAPKRRQTWPDRKPDGDKLDRSTHDALTTARVWNDDAQVVEWSGAKRYPGEGLDALPHIGAVIRVWRIA